MKSIMESVMFFARLMAFFARHIAEQATKPYAKCGFYSVWLVWLLGLALGFSSLVFDKGLANFRYTDWLLILGLGCGAVLYLTINLPDFRFGPKTDAAYDGVIWGCISFFPVCVFTALFGITYGAFLVLTATSRLMGYELVLWMNGDG